jgi:pimeloyl-ACP methyl ester carboxylesterase
MKPLHLTAFTVAATSATPYIPPWLTLPPTPELPPPSYEAHAHVNNISLWHALYGPSVGMAGPPVILLHGGKISSRWWGDLVEYLAPTFSVIVIDTRAHGRSTDDLSVPLSYDLFARDTISLLDTLGITSASFVGWSDGANTALDIAMNYSSRADSIIAFGANFSPDQANITGIEGIPFLNDLLNREESEYNELNPNPNWILFNDRVNQMQSVSPAWDQRAFNTISPFGVVDPSPRILCADADHEEVVIRSTVFQINEMVCIFSKTQSLSKIEILILTCQQIQNSQLTVLPGVSHFA